MQFAFLGQRSPRVGRRLGAAALSCVALISTLGVAPMAQASVATTHVTPLRWTAGTPLVSAGGGVNAVSCADATFCVAVDRTGSVSRYDGSTWSSPAHVDGANSLTAISCPTTTFCVATDASGNYVTMSNGTWTVPTPFAATNSPVMQSVSCSSAGFCLAVGETANFSPIDYYWFNDVWTADSVVFSPSDTSAFDAVSCTATDVCFATDLGGGVMTFTFTATPTPSLAHAAAPTSINPSTTGYIGQSISCVSATSCVVGSRSNQVSVLSGSTWTTSAVFAAGANGVLVSCALSTCVANDAVGQAVSAVAPFTTWSTTGSLDMLSQIDGLSCFAVTPSIACVAVDNDGFSIAISLGVNAVPTYTPASSSFDPPHTVSSVACANTTYCIASDTAGETMTFSHGVWGKPHRVTSTPLGIREVRCGASTNPQASLACAAIVGNFHALSLRSNRARWKPVLSPSTPSYAVSCATRCEYLSPEGRSSGLVRGYLPRLAAGAIATDVSCASATTCVAIDNAGHSYVAQDATWIPGPVVESVATRQLWSISCAAATFCVAVDIQGYAYLYNGISWSVGTKVSKLGLYAVSCGATYFCVATDLLGGAFVYDGVRWHPTQNVAGFNILHGVSCPSATTCVAVDSAKAYTLTIPTDATTLAVRPLPRGTNERGRTVIAVTASALAAPQGVVTLSAGTKPTAPFCTATLRRFSATTSSAHCTIDTTRVGATLFDATFAGSFGFAPSSAPPYLEVVVAP